MNEDTASEAGSVIEREQDAHLDTGRTFFTFYTFTSINLNQFIYFVT